MAWTMITMALASAVSIPAAFGAGRFCDSCLEEPKPPALREAAGRYRLFLAGFAVLGCAGGFLFSKYGYSVTEMCRRFFCLYTVIAVAEIDRKSYIIPNKAVLALFAVQAVLLAVEFFTLRTEWTEHMFSCVLGLLAGGITFLIGYFISRGGMGLGDVKLLAAMGFLLGDGTIVPIILLSLIFSAVYGVVQLLKKKLKAKDEMPYAPFVAYASVLLILLGF